MHKKFIQMSFWLNIKYNNIYIPHIFIIVEHNP